MKKILSRMAYIIAIIMQEILMTMFIIVCLSFNVKLGFFMLILGFIIIGILRHFLFSEIDEDESEEDEYYE